MGKNKLQTKTSQKLSKEILVNLLELADSGKQLFVSDEIQGLTICKAQNSKQLSFIRKDKGEQYLQIIIAKVLKESLRFLPNKMEPDDIVYFAKYIIKRFWDWKFDDYILCLKKGIDGEYGKIFGDFNMSVFILWAEEYDKAKGNFLYDKHLNTKEQITTTEYNKVELYEDRKDKRGGDIQLPKKISTVIPDENFFKTKKHGK